MNLKKIGVGVSLLFVTQAQANLPPSSQSETLEHFGKMKVGDSISRFPVLSEETGHFREIGRTAKLYFYLFKADLPNRCVNLQCGTFARQIIKHGDLLIGGADKAFEQEVGLTENPSRPESLLVVSDNAGKIVGIYRDISRKNIAEILEKN
jgi:hypothetical protein